MKTILYILAVCVTGGLLLCVLSVYAGSSIIVNGTGPTHIVGAREGNVRGYTVYIPSSNYCDGRFTIFDASTNVVIDNDSGLTWMRDANIGGEMDWTNATDYCDNLETNGYSDWRLPSIAEFSRDEAHSGSSIGLISLGTPILPSGHPFINIETTWYYWSSTVPSGFEWAAYTVDMSIANANPEAKINPDFFTWPCRGP